MLELSVDCGLMLLLSIGKPFEFVLTDSTDSAKHHKEYLAKGKVASMCRHGKGLAQDRVGLPCGWLGCADNNQATNSLREIHPPAHPMLVTITV